MADFLVQQRSAKSVQNDADFSEKLEHTGPAEKKEVATVPERVAGKYAGSAFAKRISNRAVCLDHQIERWKRVKMSESRTLARERGGSEWEDGEERMDSTVKEGRLQEGKGG